MALGETAPIIGIAFADILFVMLAAVMLGSALMVVLLRDIIRSGLAMIVCFAALAGIYVLLQAPLVAAAQVLVYIGAISVLILFAIMLTQTKAGPARLVFQTQSAAAAVAAIVLALVVAVAVGATDWGEVGERMHTATDTLARVLFDEFVLPFEVVSVLLLAAVIGAVYLAKREESGPS
ncbi:MAG: NADH-quinone oxidoreductase subunit J [Chloroflexota bacterium]